MSSDQPLQDKLAACRLLDSHVKPPPTMAEFRADLVDDIFHVLDHPTIYVGDGCCAPDMLESALWHLCQVLVRTEGKNLRHIQNGVSFGDENVTFSEAFRRLHPDAKPSEAIAFVISEWRKILKELTG